MQVLAALLRLGSSSYTRVKCRLAAKGRALWKASQLINSLPPAVLSETFPHPLHVRRWCLLLVLIQQDEASITNVFTRVSPGQSTFPGKGSWLMDGG